MKQVVALGLVVIGSVGLQAQEDPDPVAVVEAIERIEAAQEKAAEDLAALSQIVASLATAVQEMTAPTDEEREASRQETLAATIEATKEAVAAACRKADGRWAWLVGGVPVNGLAQTVTFRGCVGK